MFFGPVGTVGGPVPLIVPVHGLGKVLRVVRCQVQGDIDGGDPATPRGVTPVPIYRRVPVTPAAAGTGGTFDPVTKTDTANGLTGVPVTVLPVPTVGRIMAGAAFKSVYTTPEVYKFAGAVCAVIGGIIVPTVGSIQAIIPY